MSATGLEPGGSGGVSRPKALPPPPRGTRGPASREPNLNFTATIGQPSYSVRVWRNKDGVEWRRLNADVLSIGTSHALGQPAGEFTLGLAPRRFALDKDDRRGVTWADILKPMDYVEIWLCQRTVQMTDQDIRAAIGKDDPSVPHVVMRGFVTNVRLVDATDEQTGEPRRRVMVNGMNFGKLWIQYKMYTLFELGDSVYQQKFTNIFLSAKGGDGFISPAELMGLVYNAFFRPQMEPLIKQMEGYCAQIKNHGIYCDVPGGLGRRPNHGVYLGDQSLTAFQGSLDTLIRQYGKPPYTELFTYDEPWPTEVGGAPRTIWRWSPYLDTGNRLAMPSHYPPGYFPKVRVLRAAEITEHDIGTSDNDVYTYYWAEPGQSMGTVATPLQVKQAAPGFIDVNKFKIFGYRPLIATFNMYALRPDTRMQTATDPSIYAEWVAKLTVWLAQVFSGNMENFEGQIVCHGRPDIQIGEYVDLPEVGLRYYVEGVQHTIILNGTFRTVLTVTRGVPLGDRDSTLPPTYQFDQDLGGVGTKRDPAPSHFPDQPPIIGPVLPEEGTGGPTDNLTPAASSDVQNFREADQATLRPPTDKRG